MSTKLRKQQYRKASSNNRKAKKLAGLIRYERWIKPDWKILLDEFLNKIKIERKGNEN